MEKINANFDLKKRLLEVGGGILKLDDSIYSVDTIYDRDRSEYKLIPILSLNGIMKIKIAA
ncbi:MAG: hypothetical protein AABX77_03420 [Nanoarchaeota archaeon]